MARRHGRKGVLYIGFASEAAAASPAGGITKWSFESSTDKEDVSAMGDSNKQYVAGLPDASGDFEFKWSDTHATTFAASRDGSPRKFYLYPSTDVASIFFSGTAYFDFSIEGSVDGAIEGSCEWMAAGDITATALL